MSNYDQTREPLQTDNLILNLGIIAGWAALIKSHPEAFDEKDLAVEQYLRRGYALMRDVAQGTPNANASIYRCDVPDNEVAGKLHAYVPFVMQRFTARDRGVPDALVQIIARLKVEFPLPVVS